MTLDQRPQKPFRVSIVTDASLRDLAEWISDAVHDTDDLIDFVKELDVVAADLDFAIGVRDAMEAAIKEEEEQ